jgi:hypothetical protein
MLRIWSYEDRNRELTCLYNDTLNSADIKYTCIYECEENNQINITMNAHRLRTNIYYNANICVDIGNNIIYCDMRQRIFTCLIRFFNGCISEITPYELYCKMIALYRVDWDLIFVTHIIEHIRQCKNYRLFRIIIKRSPVMF